jgi:hypothetical protein
VGKQPVRCARRSEKDVDRTLQAMASTYASAELNIIAAGGPEADHGLRGIGGPSQSRWREDEVNCTNLLYKIDFPWQSIWASRG